MEPNLRKIPIVAKGLGVTVKTIYNWISLEKLEMPQPGYVDYNKAYDVLVQQHAHRSINSYFMAIKGIKRDSNGRFSGKP